jgi:hypothetical protein
MKRTLGIIAAVATALLMIGAPGASAKGKTVKISGRAYVFNHMDTYISGATVKVRELPKLSTTTDALGDYELTVPNDANVTPYILSGEGMLTRHTSPTDDTPMGQVQTHWNEIDLQTFHTRGRNIVNANFQAPGDAEFLGLKALLNVPAREDGRPEQCAIVTTASDRDVRGVDYPTFWANTFGGHGVPGATAVAYPSLGKPIYFNESVIPDKTKTETSEDGGIIWPIVPTGRYRIVTKAPGKRFASVLATCAPGRVINPNPPWGAYELKPGEKPLAASNVAGKVMFAEVNAQPLIGRQRIGRRDIYLTVLTKEKLTVRYALYRGRKLILKKGPKVAKPGERIFRGRIKRKVASGRGRMVIRLTDASGVTVTTTRKIRIPRAEKQRLSGRSGR